MRTLLLILGLINIMKGIFQRIWAGYGFLIMSIFVLLYIPIALLILLVFGKRSEQPILQFGYKVIARLISFMLLIRYKLISTVQVNKNDSYVLISNHKSMIDVFASEVTCPVIFKFLGKLSTGRIPVWGLLIRRLCILVDRSNKASRNLGYEKMAKNLKEGFSVFIFPEGTRNNTPQLLAKFYNGAFRLAIEEKKSILVQTLIGSDSIINSVNNFNLSPGKVLVYWDGPIDTQGYTLENLDELKEKVKSIMLDRLKRHEQVG